MRMPRTTVSMREWDASFVLLARLEMLDHRRQCGVDGAGDAELFTEPRHRAVHVIDLGIAAFHQVLPHRGNGPRTSEHAIDQGDEILVEGHTIGTCHREALVDDRALQLVELRIDDAADFAAEE